MDQIHHIRVRNYRSLRDFSLPVENPCVVTGGNGTGKSSLYKVLALLQRSAQARFSKTVTQDGGMPSLLWAGQRTKADKTQFRMSMEVEFSNWRYYLSSGLPTLNEGAFTLDPRVKEETLFYLPAGKRPMPFMKRSKMSVNLRDRDNKMQTRAFEIMGSESALAQINEPEHYPELSRLRDTISGWRFYHHFNTGVGSPIRQAQIGTMTPMLAADGRDLPSALASIQELGEFDLLAEALDAAFPGHRLLITEDKGRFSFEIEQPGLFRPLKPDELSDGTLRYLCLLAVLCGLRLPTFLVLNEPETSLHEDLLPPLADLIVAASKRTQVLVVTHAPVLAARIAEQTGVQAINLFKDEGETKIQGQNWDGSVGDQD